MPTKARTATSLYLNPDELETLQELAAFCGFFQKRGRLQLPNVTALNRAMLTLPKERWPEIRELLNQPKGEPKSDV